MLRKLHKNPCLREIRERLIVDYELFTSLTDFTEARILLDVFITRRFRISLVNYSFTKFAAKAPEGVTAYAGTINGSNVQLTEYANGVIPANKGVLLMSNTKTTATFTLADESDVTTQGNDLTGVLTTTELSSVTNHDQVRIFSKKNEVAGFYAPNSNITTLAANKAYIIAPAGTQALTLNFGGGDVTNINTIVNTTEDANAPIYDLTGRRVTKAFKGIYIKNGKKFIK